MPVRKATTKMSISRDIRHSQKQNRFITRNPPQTTHRAGTISLRSAWPPILVVYDDTSHETHSTAEKFKLLIFIFNFTFQISKIQFKFPIFIFIVISSFHSLILNNSFLLSFHKNPYFYTSNKTKKTKKTKKTNSKNHRNRNRNVFEEIEIGFRGLVSLCGFVVVLRCCLTW